jgi:hypothetical protein
MDVGDPTAPTLVTRSFFDTGRRSEVMKGKLLRLTAEQADGRVFWDEVTTWLSPPRVLYTGTNGTNIVYVHPTGTRKSITELGQGVERTLESEFEYDAYGTGMSEIAEALGLELGRKTATAIVDLKKDATARLSGEAVESAVSKVGGTKSASKTMGTLVEGGYKIMQDLFRICGAAFGTQAALTFNPMFLSQKS